MNKRKRVSTAAPVMEPGLCVSAHVKQAEAKEKARWVKGHVIHAGIKQDIKRVLFFL